MLIGEPTARRFARSLLTFATMLWPASEPPSSTGARARWIASDACAMPLKMLIAVLVMLVVRDGAGRVWEGCVRDAPPAAAGY
jgi:hypothetical protein